MTMHLAKLTGRRIKGSAFVLLLVCVSSAASAGQTNRKQLIRQARSGFYSLRRSGLVEFQATIKPNWATIAKGIESNSEGLKVLNGLHFWMSLNSDGKVTVSHRADVAPAGQQRSEDLNQIFSGMEEMITGFFGTWSSFMLTSPLPEVESEYDLASEGDGYLLSYRDGATRVATVMTKDLLITEMKISATDFNSSIWPHFTKSREGLLLTGYDANYQPTSGPGTTHLKVEISYLEAGGLQLPQTLHLQGSYNGTSFAVETAFEDYQVKKR
jgi:hypothetical protein